MAGWMHFIDKQDYSVSKFMKEAQEVGVALTVSLETLINMEWNDRIALLQAGGAAKLKSTVMFAEFRLDRITGLSAESVKILTGKFPCRMYDLGGGKIIRLHTAHNTGFAYDIDVSLKKVAEVLIDVEVISDIGVPMIACMPHQIEAIEKPLPMFRDLLYRSGYRRFDVAGARERISKQRSLNRKRRPHLGGQWEPNGSEGEDAPLQPFAGDIESAVVIDLTTYMEFDTL